MKKNSDSIRLLVLGAASLLFAFLLPQVVITRFFSGPNDFSYIHTYYLAKKFIKPPRLIGIELDDYSLNKIGQRWPLKRSVYAKLIDTLNKEAVAAVGIDVFFQGASDDANDDLLFADALKNSAARVVLAYPFDYEKLEPALPYELFREKAYALGMLNTPLDADHTARRLRSYIKLDGKDYYSLTVALAAAYLETAPGKVALMPPLINDTSALLKYPALGKRDFEDKGFLIHYLLKQGDVATVSLYDALYNLDAAKKKYGEDFLKNALVFIYPQAQILHDVHPTPLGQMPGGMLHFNGVSDIVSGRFLKDSALLLLVMMVLSFAALFYIIRYFSLISGVLLACGVLMLGFWLIPVSSLWGLRFDFSRLVIFCVSFFTAGSLYKYLLFQAQLRGIKNKATIDPVRGLFTLRYFYYRLDLELRKFYINRDFYLISVHFESLKDALLEMPHEKVKSFWQQVRHIVSVKHSFWSVLGQEELIGCVVVPKAKIMPLAHSLRNTLGALFLEQGIRAQVRLGFLRFRKEFSIRQLLFFLSEELKKIPSGVCFFKDEDLAHLSKEASFSGEKISFMELLDEDVEEKNRQLSLLVENLNKEYLKTKESFFQLISSLVNALEARDPYTQGHSERVARYSLKLAEKMGWDTEAKEKLNKAALLHDLGKIGIPDTVLHKKTALTEEEFEFIRKHEVIAVKILEPVKDFKEILPWIMYHHERWDGKGYPHGLAANAIPVASQIISLADVFDALTTGRDYKGAFSQDAALQEIARNKGIQFNPQLAELFIAVVSEYSR